ncbi:MAG: radical SAM protein [Candidatus Omnitrophica bacterium]|nr:radical SAM protein [Candidatus Omnitrophota bacterium]
MIPVQERPKIRVGLVQINNSFSNQNYLPLSVGLIQAYAQKYAKDPGRYQFLLPVYSRIPVERAVQLLESADLIFFSVYVWNFRISLEAARRLKEIKPEVLIVFGGPHVPDRLEGFHRKYPFIDLACHGEGEAAALAILEQFPAKNWQAVPSISYLNSEGVLVQNPRGERIKEISEIPSPYLEGIFTPLMEANPEEHWIVLWETNRGCPFSCTFCDWGSSTQSRVYTFDLERLYKEVDWFAQHRIEFVFCCDANYGMLPRDLEITQYLTEAKKRHGYPHAISVQNTKNATERAYQVQKMLSDAGMNKGVTIALQSVDPATLKSIKRSNISTESYQELQRRFTRDRVETYTDMILGLPGETYVSFADGVSAIIANGQHNRIQFNNLTILPNAEMGDPEYQKKYDMILVETKIINIHGALAESDQEEISEIESMVVGTGTLSKEDWVRTRTFSWMTALLHFDKILQIPFVLLHEICSANYRELVEVFLGGSLQALPLLQEIQTFFCEKGREIQRGAPEYCRSEKWLNIWWPADEYIFIQLCIEKKLQAFYEQAEQILQRFLSDQSLEVPADLLHQAVQYNQALIKLPFQTEDLILSLDYNIREFYQAAIEGRPIPLERKECAYRIDRTSKKWASWEDWCREVVWYGNKKGAYLYGNNTIDTQLAGHY